MTTHRSRGLLFRNAGCKLFQGPHERSAVNILFDGRRRRDKLHSLVLKRLSHDSDGGLVAAATHLDKHVEWFSRAAGHCGEVLVHEGRDFAGPDGSRNDQMILYRA